MNIEKVLADLDNLFAENKLDKVEAFLQDNYETAMKENELGVAISLLNELIGFYREMTMHNEACETAHKAFELVEKSGLDDTVSHATTLLNAANAYRGAKRYDESENAYNKTEEIYEKVLSKDDFRWASLYNNKSLLYQEKEDYKEAAKALLSALFIVKEHPEAQIELAITYTNLGQVYINLEDNKEAEKYLLEAEAIFAKGDKKDYHYAGCANALGTLYYQFADYDSAIKYYEEAILNMYNTAGITGNYKAIRKNLMSAYKMAGKPGYDNMLDLCEAYYETYGKPMLENKFPDYADRIAVGLCGEGSECFGFEDEISLDHDCGPGFAMWISKEDFEIFGDKLNEEYAKLPKVFAGYVRNESAMGAGRCGALLVDDFYKRVLGADKLPQSYDEWMNADETGLAAAVNGRVFVDKSGEFSKKREYLNEYYPDSVWYERIAKTLIKCAQTGQYNYGRCMARTDYVTAHIALGEYMQNIMELVFLLNRKYAPYYKWQHKAMADLEYLPEIGDILTAICDMPNQREAWKDYVYNGNPNNNDMIAMSIEIVAKLVVNRLQEMGLSSINEPYLEIQAKEVLKNMEREMEKKMNESNKNEVIDKIIKMEWDAFDKVRNEGGRASCQDDWETFEIMRKSQYMTWNEEMLQVYAEHFSESVLKGRNLIAEKYGRMMESTSPEEYSKIKDGLPKISKEQKNITEEIVKIQVAWMEEFAKNYPNLAGNARSIHTSEDNYFNTSYETYLRGELLTYSDEMIMLYGRFIAGIAKSSGNLAQMTMENTVHLYGYESLDAAERS